MKIVHESQTSRPSQSLTSFEGESEVKSLILWLESMSQTWVPISVSCDGKTLTFVGKDNVSMTSDLIFKS